MARKYVITMVPADKWDAVNSYMIAMFGDDPGSEEIPQPQAYIEGEPDTVPTHSFGCANCSQADATGLAAFVLSQTGCASAEYPIANPPSWWGEAYTLWQLLPAVIVTP